MRHGNEICLCPGLERSEECGLFFEGLECTVTELGGGIDELELDFLQISAGGVDHQGLAEGDDTLLGTGKGALQ